MFAAETRFASTRRILSFTAALVAGAALAHGQTMRASCDNRNGTAFADVIDSSDPNQSGYNVDPSEIYRTYQELTLPVNQSNGGSSANAQLLVTSKFFGANPSVSMRGFFTNNFVIAFATRGTLPVLAFANDNSNICFDVSGASAGNPLRIRLLGTIAATGGTVSRIRLSNPSNVDFFNTTTPGAINKVFSLTTNGTYHLYATLDTGNVQPTSGSQQRGGNVYASVLCLGDFDGTGVLTVVDIFDYLAAWFAGNLSADSNANGSVQVDDIFTMLRSWFAGCGA